MFHHVEEHPADMIVVFSKVAVSIPVKIIMRKAEVKPGLGLIGFGITVAEFTYKMVALPPGLSNVAGNRAGRPANLICQRILLILRKFLRFVEYF